MSKYNALLNFLICSTTLFRMINRINGICTCFPGSPFRFTSKRNIIRILNVLKISNRNNRAPRILASNCFLNKSFNKCLINDFLCNDKMSVKRTRFHRSNIRLNNVISYTPRSVSCLTSKILNFIKPFRRLCSNFITHLTTFRLFFKSRSIINGHAIFHCGRDM